MALQKTITKVVYGEQLTFKNAYHQITSISGNKDGIDMQVTTYKDTEKEIVLGCQSYSFVPLNDDDAQRWDKQGYEHLKTLPEFAEAIDC